MKILSLLPLAICSAVAAEAVLVDEQFSDGRRSGQNPPQSLEWFSSVPGSGLEEGDGKMTLRNAQASAKHAVAYFLPAGKLTTLKVGDSLELSFKFTPLDRAGDAGNSLRFGFFNSATDSEGRFNRDGQNPPESTAQGYVAALSARSDSATAISLFRRHGTGRLLTNSDAYQVLKNQVQSFGLTAGQTYKVTLTLKRESQQEMSLTATVSEGDLDGTFELAGTDAQEIVSEFDGIGFSIFNAVPEAEFSDIRVTYHD